MSTLDKIKEIFRLSTVSIQLGAGEYDRGLYTSFTKRHPRLFLIRNKTIGVGIIDSARFKKPADYMEAVNGKNSAAYFSRKASRAGYRFATVDANKFSDAIHLIHHSAESRQGIPLDKNYLDKRESYPTDDRHAYFGIFKDDVLVAYLWSIRSGQLLIINRIMGHAQHLKDGVMYLLVTSFVEQSLVNSGKERLFIMYDTMLGASGGLRMFKERCGFRPYRVKWSIA